MMTSAEAARFAVDTSVAVAALDGGHAAHAVCRDVVRGRRPELAGHAAFETYSVLTRLPGSLAVDPVDAAALMDWVFPGVVHLRVEDAEPLRRRLATLGVVGGSVYDALVGAAALAHARILLTRDHRARRTYDLLGVRYEFVGP